MPLRGRPVQRSRRAGTCQALPLRKLQEGVWERVYGLCGLAARRLRDERGHIELRRTGLLPSLRLTPTGHFRPRRYPHRDSDRDARRRTVRSEARGRDLGEAPRVLDCPCRGCSAVRREGPLATRAAKTQVTAERSPRRGSAPNYRVATTPDCGSRDSSLARRAGLGSDLRRLLRFGPAPVEPTPAAAAVEAEHPGCPIRDPFVDTVSHYANRSQNLRPGDLA